MKLRTGGQRSQSSEVLSALQACRQAVGGIAVFSAIINILMLSGSLYMLQVYDRVLSSRSISTLVGISLILLAAYILQGSLDTLRSKMLARVGARFDELLSGRIFDLIATLPLRGAKQADSMQPIRDLDNIRGFLSGTGPTALFDMPFMPIFFACCFLIHPWIGVMSVGGGIIIVGLTILTEVKSRGPMSDLTRSLAERHVLAETSRRNAEALKAMGMTPRIAALWQDANDKYMASQRRSSDVAGGFGSMSKVLRMMLQSGVLAVGAYLVINGQASAGIIIAGSILSARALAPVDLAIANWKGFVAARQSWQRLTRLLAMMPAQAAPMALQPPERSLTVENATVAPPGSERIVVQDVSFSLQKGHGLGIIGPSGSGKSSLARLLIGVWQPIRGRIRLDGAAFEQWPPEMLGASTGYLPQDVELLAGSVAQNIARFASPIDADAVIAAATAASVHDLIVSLPDGYETQVGEGGAALSAGQAQRIALARALYGDPFLVVLDEPNSNLDAEGDEALSRAIMGVRARGGIVIVVAHRPSAIASVDLLLMMNQGRVQAFGPKEDVLAKVVQRDGVAPRPLKVVPEAGGAKP